MISKVCLIVLLQIACINLVRGVTRIRDIKQSIQVVRDEAGEVFSESVDMFYPMHTHCDFYSLSQEEQNAGPNEYDLCASFAESMKEDYSVPPPYEYINGTGNNDDLAQIRDNFALYGMFFKKLQEFQNDDYFWPCQQPSGSPCSYTCSNDKLEYLDYCCYIYGTVLPAIDDVVNDLQNYLGQAANVTLNFNDLHEDATDSEAREIQLSGAYILKKHSEHALTYIANYRPPNAGNRH